MEKEQSQNTEFPEYKHNTENQENHKRKEPALVYSSTPPEATDKSYYRSVEELIEGVRQGTKEIEEGKFYTHEEVMKMMKP